MQNAPPGDARTGGRAPQGRPRNRTRESSHPQWIGNRLTSRIPAWPVRRRERPSPPDRPGDRCGVSGLDMAMSQSTDPAVEDSAPHPSTRRDHPTRGNETLRPRSLAPGAPGGRRGARATDRAAPSPRRSRTLQWRRDSNGLGPTSARALHASSTALAEPVILRGSVKRDVFDRPDDLFDTSGIDPDPSPALCSRRNGRAFK